MAMPARLLVFTALAPVLAQVNPTPPAASREPVLRITVNLVQVDAVVTDSSGRQVTNLTADDFEVLEDGRPQKITALSYVKVSEPAPKHVKANTRAPTTTPPPPGRILTPQQVRRTIVLMADDLGLSFESTARVRRSLKKFVDEQMQEGDLVAIIRTRGGMGALEQFTADKHILYAAIDRVRWYPSGLGGTGAFEPLGYDALSNAAKLQMAGPGGVQQNGGGRTRQIEEGRTQNFSLGTLAAVNFVVRALRQLPGRKALVLFSDGVPVFLRGRVQPQMLNDLQQLTDLANRSAVLIYAVDARGIETFDLTAADNLDDPAHHNNPMAMAAEINKRRERFLDSQQGLDILALRTGGFVIHDSNDLNWGLGRVLDDLSGYYLIGYKPDESSFDRETGRRRFHKIQVKVRIHGLRVRSRTGYFGISDELAKPVFRTSVEQLAAALTSPFSSGDLKVRLTCLFSGGSKLGAMVRVLFHVDAAGLTFFQEPGGMRKSVVELVALAFDE